MQARSQAGSQAQESVQSEPQELEVKQSQVILVTYPQYNKDPLFKKILEMPKEYCNFKVKDELVQLRLKD